MRTPSALALVLLLAACPHNGPAGGPAGASSAEAMRPAPCGKDVDCKGPRICERGACVDPAGVSAPSMDVPPAPAVVVDGGAPDAASTTVALVGHSPLFHVDRQHTGRSRFRVNQNAPREIGRVATGGTVVSSPALTDEGVAIFGSHDRAVRAAFPADKKDGGVDVRWSRPTGDLVWCSPALGPDPKGNLTAYVGSDDDRLYALDPADGAVKWTYTAGPCRRAVGVGPEASRCDVDGVTVGLDGSVYFTADGAYGLGRDGSLRFRFPLPVHCGSTPAVAADGSVIFGCQDGRVYALGPDGSRRWEWKTGDDVDSSPAIATDGTIYVGSDDGKLYALKPNGELKWSVRTGGPIRATPAIGADGTVYVGSLDGSFYAVRPDGNPAWSFRAGDRIVSSAAIDAVGVLVFGAEDDRLYALGPDGRLLWSVLLGGDVDGTPVIGPAGIIWVGADDKALHLLR